MINKDTVIIKLSELKVKGIDTTEEVKRVVSSNTVPLSVIKKIKENFSIESANFYKHLKTNYYKSRSPLYKNILRATTPVITLSSLQLQILLWGKHLDDPATFYEETRLSEITSCLQTYAETYNNMHDVITLLEKIKDDILILDNI